jgi:hypothetical protein
MSEHTHTSGADWWRHISGVLVLIQTVALIASVYLLREQINDLQDTKSSRSADFIFRFNEQLDKPPLSKLRIAIVSSKPVLKKNGGKFSEDDLEQYLDLWEGLNDLYMKGLIGKEMFYNSYSYDIDKAHGNAEVQSFVKESRKESSDFYTGFDNLVKEMKEFPKKRGLSP